MSTNYWAVKFDGKRMHIEYATRLPRKRKKLIKHIFDYIGPKGVDFVCVSPTVNEVLESWKKND